MPSSMAHPPICNRPQQRNTLHATPDISGADGPEGGEAGAWPDHDDGAGSVRGQSKIWVLVDVHRDDITDLRTCATANDIC